MSKEQEKKEVDLTLIKKILSELEATLEVADKIRAERGDIHQYIIETSKASGLAAGIMREASMLVGDIHMMVQNSTGPSTSSSKKESLDDLLSLFSKSGSHDKN